MTSSLPIDLNGLNDLLAGGSWPHGRLLEGAAERIGVGFGLSGTSFRVSARTGRGERISLVLKFEAEEKIRRAVEFRRANEEMLEGSIPRLFGALLGLPGGAGVLAMEDVTPATQCDELAPGPLPAARGLIEILAGLHARTWVEDGSDVLAYWAPSAWHPDRWTDRLTRAVGRYPEAFPPELEARLERLNIEAQHAGRELARGSAAWTHGDPHLDNVRWRPDGTTVVMDWATATVGPPAVDLAVLLLSLSFGPRRVLAPATLIGMYVESLRALGTNVSVSRTTRDARLAVTRQLQGMIGFIGVPTEPADPRGRLLRDDAPTRVGRAVTWLDARRLQ